MQPKQRCLRPLGCGNSAYARGATGMLLLELPESVLNWGDFAAANNVKGWLDASVPLCQWSGVQCDGDGRVTALCASLQRAALRSASAANSARTPCFASTDYRRQLLHKGARLALVRSFICKWPRDIRSATNHHRIRALAR